MRMFLSFHVPEKISRGLLDEFVGLPVVPYPAENLHITFKFIGEVLHQDMETLKAVISVIAEYGRPFQFTPTHFSVENDRLRLYLKTDPLLSTIQSAFSRELEKIPLGKKDENPYAPHITLGKPLQGLDLAAVRVDLQKYIFEISELGLYQSEQGQNQTGVYTLLHAFVLGKDAHGASVKK